MKRRDGDGVNGERRGFCKFLLLGTISLILPGEALGAANAKPAARRMVRHHL